MKLDISSESNLSPIENVVVPTNIDTGNISGSANDQDSSEESSGILLATQEIEQESTANDNVSINITTKNDSAEIQSQEGSFQVVAGTQSVGVAMPAAATLSVMTMSTTFNTTSKILSGLFDLISSNATLDELRRENPNMPVFALFAIMIAQTQQVTIEQYLQNIESARTRQAALAKEAISMREFQLSEQRKLSSSDWKARAGTSPSGSPTVEPAPTEAEKCGKIIAAVVHVLAAVFTFGLSLLITYMVSSLAGLVVNCLEDSALKRKLEKILSFINPVTAVADAIVIVVCEIGGYNPNDEKMQKLKMGLKIAGDFVMAIVVTVALIALSVATAGAGAVAAIPAIIGIISGLVAVVSGAFEIVKGKKNLEIAEKRKIVNQLTAVIEKIKIELEVVSQDIDVLIELFSSSISDIRMEYEKAARMIKEYNDTKQMIARNIRA